MTASEPAPPPAPPVVHPTAVVMPGAELGTGVEVGPYAVLEPGVEVGAGSRIAAHAQLLGRTVLGARCVVGPGTVLGGVPQDAKYAGERTLVRIGADCVFHEHATVHRATGEGGETVLGAGVRLMVGAHVGHNCTVGDGAILVNGAALGGHVVVGAGAFLSQTSGVHQFGRVGRLTLVGGATMLTRDAPPFSVVVGSYPPRWRAPNTIGLRRAGFLPAQRDAIRTALRALFAPGANPRQVAEQYANHADPNLAELAAFVLAGRRQLVAPPARDPADEADAD